MLIETCKDSEALSELKKVDFPEARILEALILPEKYNQIIKVIKESKTTYWMLTAKIYAEYQCH